MLGAENTAPRGMQRADVASTEPGFRASMRKQPRRKPSRLRNSRVVFSRCSWMATTCGAGVVWSWSAGQGPQRRSQSRSSRELTPYACGVSDLALNRFNPNVSPRERIWDAAEYQIIRSCEWGTTQSAQNDTSRPAAALTKQMNESIHNFAMYKGVRSFAILLIPHDQGGRSPLACNTSHASYTQYK